MNMKMILVLSFALANAAFDGALARAATGPVLDCLQASADRGSLSACLNEPKPDASEAVHVGTTGSRLAAAPSLSVAAMKASAEKPSRKVPTPTGYTDAEDGSLKAGFYNGLDSGFKTAFMVIEYAAVEGMMACGAPGASNAGTLAFTVLGVLLAIPAALIGVVVGAPIGAAAGMVAEKAAPGSTRKWFTF